VDARVSARLERREVRYTRVHAGSGGRGARAREAWSGRAHAHGAPLCPRMPRGAAAHSRGYMLRACVSCSLRQVAELRSKAADDAAADLDDDDDLTGRLSDGSPDEIVA
jgi:hypothetical protein